MNLTNTTHGNTSELVFDYFNVETDSETAIAFKVLSYAVIMVVSIVGNSFVILAFRRNVTGQMRSVYNLMVVSIAVGDLLLAVCSIPERITRIVTYDSWLVPGDLGTALCKLVNFVEKISITGSLLHLCVLAYDRFLVVYYPTRAMVSLRSSKIASAIIWTITCTYWSPILYYGAVKMEEGHLACGVRSHTPYWKEWYLAYVVLILIALVAIFVFYLLVACKIWLRRVPGNQTRNINRLMERTKRRMARMVSVIVCAYYICFVPYWIGWISCSYIRSQPKAFCNPVYHFINIMVSYVNCAVNPVVCMVFNHQYRQEACHVLKDPFGLRTNKMRLVVKRRKSSTTVDGPLMLNSRRLRQSRRGTQLLVISDT
ncbi:RYamide receptor [Nematostella vectensis]|uniref:RYamide receptor n=1 Tax=Nematostella vectensis TaxID=45351 RepID=UPI0020770170|nr:RYamide receptor [Nematostella vectensis]XP_032218154.2 RYamide receptor [Nematostella vectensis]XP_032218155.2 RYamide receptor [Nematostella vectensis]XP_032218156.2 RYamide receptor [Nematostella vectensis]XP_032218157.2 RYamide receptor [Nematostella vectensis]XP_032218159.2 RYamide receptor [Nematostella vectensis]